MMRSDLEAASPVTVLQAERENLGDLKLYRIPIPVSVASNSQKQVALLEQQRAKVDTFYRWRANFSTQETEPQPADQILRMENRKKDGLGLPLPAGTFTLYTMRGDQPFVLGQGEMTDRAVDETVEVTLSETPGVRVTQREVDRLSGDQGTELIATNDLPYAVKFEARFNEYPRSRLIRSSEKVARRDGAWWWITKLPANGRRTLTIRFRDD